MATKNSIIQVSPAGYVDGQSPGVLNIPDFDPAHFVAPGANGTWTNLVAGTTTTDTALAAAGYLVINMAGTLYRVLAVTAT